MNSTHVRAGRLAGLHRLTLRARGGAIAVEIYNACADQGFSHGGPALRRELDAAARAGIEVGRKQRARELRLRARRDVGYDTRLARANGWGSAGQCPAGHGAKTPAVGVRAAALRRRIRDARQVAPVAVRDCSSRMSPRQPAGGGVR